jgi:hypothetical protein
MAYIMTCISCGQRQPRSSNNARALFCWDCREQRHREQLRAISAVAAAIQRGELAPATECDCTDCSAPAKQYDHRDYTKPLDVQPVCVRCNQRRGPALDSQMRAILPVTAGQPGVFA